MSQHTDTASSPPAPGALPAQARSLAPDLARGVMLLIIATVHAHMFRMMAGGGGYTLDGPLDTAVTVFMALFGENRGYPMFAALFGYGLVQIHRHRSADGQPWPWVRRLLRRRGRWLVVIGVAHTVLLFYGDVIAVYGIITLLFTAALRSTDRRLLTHAAVWLAVGPPVYAVATNLAIPGGQQSEAYETTLLSDLLGRLATTPFLWPLMIVISVFPVLVGIWAARRHLLEEPQQHRTLLRRVMIAGIGASVLGGLPYTLVTSELWQQGPLATTVLFWLHLVTGYAGGFGYAAAIALLTLRLRRRGPVTTALAATGQRSMTCYLLQSVAWVVLVPSYTLGVLPALGDAQAVGLGAAVWLATVVTAAALHHAGFRRGPVEWFLRRVTYGRPTRQPEAGGNRKLPSPPVR